MTTPTLSQNQALKLKVGPGNEATHWNYLDGLLITDSPNNPDTDIIDLRKVWLINTDVLQDFNNTLSHTDTTVLYKKGGKIRYILSTLQEKVIAMLVLTRILSAIMS
jgi:hypothetical protein